jgi:integrase
VSGKSNVSAGKGKAVKQKAKKPRADFPLFPHDTGRWAKKVRGKFHYFGKVVGDPKGEAALQKWLEQRDDLLAGRTPRPKTEGLTVAKLCNLFLNTKSHLRDTGEIKQRTYYEYNRTTDRIVETFGGNRLVTDLAVGDFERLRAALASNLGPVGLGNEVNRVRMVFKYASDQGLIDQPVRYGQSFHRPSRKALRVARAANGGRMLEAEDLKKIINAAKPQMRAMTLLGINAGFGQTDLAILPISAVNLDTGWVSFPRPKTGIHRRVPLWPETVAALRAVSERRPAPLDEDDAGLVFLTSHGRRWVRLNEKGSPNDEIGKAFAKLLTHLGLKRPGLSFYALRHTFETIGGEARDQVAVNSIMGHADESMAAVYRERISDERLLAVTNHIRQWLFGGEVMRPEFFGREVPDCVRLPW